MEITETIDIIIWNIQSEIICTDVIFISWQDVINRCIKVITEIYNELGYYSNVLLYTCILHWLLGYLYGKDEWNVVEMQLFKGWTNNFFLISTGSVGRSQFGQQVRKNFFRCRFFVKIVINFFFFGDKFQRNLCKRVFSSYTSQKNFFRFGWSVVNHNISKNSSY